MAIPSFSTAGAVLVNASSTSASPVLPGTRVNNNVLVSYVYLKSAGVSISVSGAGWALGDTITVGNESAAWAWRIVDGAEAAPSFTWVGAAANVSQELQFTGNAFPSPIGAFGKGNGTGTSLSVTGIATTGLNSLIYVPTQVGTSQTIPSAQAVVAGYSSLGTQNNASGSLNNIVGSKAYPGTAQSYTETITSDNWAYFAIEILGTGVPTAPTLSAPRDTQTVVQVLETYYPQVKGINTQTVVQVLENYYPLTSVRNTQTVLQVLRLMSTTGLTFSNIPAAFLANNSAGSQTYGPGSNTVTQVALGTEVFDRGGYFATNAWTPPQGVVRVGGQVHISGPNITQGGNSSVYIYKNGSPLQQFAYVCNSSDGNIIDVVVDDVCSGTDVYDLRASCALTTATATFDLAANATNMWGYTLPGTGFVGFKADKNGVDQTGVVSGAVTPVTFTNTIYSQGATFSGYAWAPPRGRVSMVANLYATGTLNNVGGYAMYIYKNGAPYMGVAWTSGSDISLSLVVDDNATGNDAYSVYAVINTNSGTATIKGTTTQTNFSGYVLP